MFAELLEKAGARAGHRFIEMTASHALRIGASKFATELAQLTGGRPGLGPPPSRFLQNTMVEVDEPDPSAGKSIRDLLGSSLLGKAGGVSTDVLSGKTVGLYFSAHWCPPCRGYTPQLAAAYQKLKANGKELEIVFVSSDKDQPSFDAYFAEMPWLALPFKDRARKEALSNLLKVSSIPTLVLVTDTGELITTDGRDAISKDPQGAQFPWHPVGPEPKTEPKTEPKRFPGKILKIQAEDKFTVEYTDGKVTIVHPNPEPEQCTRTLTSMLALS
jgi:thiol-disulfide isomerase/thioredoxin